MALNETSREAFKAENKQNKEKEQSEKKSKRIRIRLIPIWLRLIIVLLLIFFSTAIGAMVGYGVIGSGNIFDVFKPSTWTYIIDLVQRK
ncbi:DNA-directed RNA polymerase subunit beta [Niallia endozanthoxylica]|uniref:DNA-directed RNA polymerase subunit beta n=1 Tax=Niallia endozanthoxylica TaxID=2036016 RepID=A0A5J5HXV3_9BACI|nr:DNA-directed RNA polymerase subunit beta [Niallia endozanthoxylica]KAA9027798.1 DNA-directed RNA polymerase subunit beta [Niallia endozanthoxylica]